MCSLHCSVMNSPWNLNDSFHLFLSLISLSAKWDDLQGLTSSYHCSLTLFLDNNSSAHLPEYKLWYFDCCTIYFIQAHGDSQTDLYCGRKLTFSRKNLAKGKFSKTYVMESNIITLKRTFFHVMKESRLWYIGRVYSPRGNTMMDRRENSRTHYLFRT